MSCLLFAILASLNALSPDVLPYANGWLLPRATLEPPRRSTCNYDRRCVSLNHNVNRIDLLLLYAQTSGVRCSYFCDTYANPCMPTLYLPTLYLQINASRVEDSGFDFRLRRDFSRSSNTSDLKIGTPVATLPGALRYRVSAGTGWPGVSIL